MEENGEDFQFNSMCKNLPEECNIEDMGESNSNSIIVTDHNN